MGWGEGKEREESKHAAAREKLFQGKVGNVTVKKQRQEEEKMGQDLGDELSAAKDSFCDRLLPRRRKGKLITSEKEGK